MRAVRFTLIVFLMSFSFCGLWHFLIVSWVCLPCVIVVFPAHAHLLFSFLMNVLWSDLFKLIQLINSKLNGSVSIFLVLFFNHTVNQETFTWPMHSCSFLQIVSIYISLNICYLNKLHKAGKIMFKPIADIGF